MKLINKTTLYFLIPAFFLIGICAVLQYQFIQSGIVNRIDKQLVKEKNLIVKQLNHLQKNAAGLTLYKTLKSDVEIIEKPQQQEQEDQFYTTKKINESDEEQVKHRVLSFSFSTVNHHYSVKIWKPMAESKTFTLGLLTTSIILFILLATFSIISNRYITKGIWKPFYQTLNELQKFNFSNPEKLSLNESNIYEFNLLNSEIELLIHKIVKDYNLYRNFIQNVSHELQTPIAVASSKVDLLHQSPQMNEFEHQQLSIINNNLNKLSRLNQSLVLLLKIENNLYSKKEKIDVNAYIDKALQNFEDVIELRNIKLSVKKSRKLEVFCNGLLIEVLIDNLIKNAVKHNLTDGFLEIETTSKEFIIRNSGEKLSVQAEFLFERFRTDSNSSDSIGLGLSIVHQICVNNDFAVKYKNKENNHSITVTFK